jgi:fumarylacetoacetate (FAA) hydrolase
MDRSDKARQTRLAQRPGRQESRSLPEKDFEESFEPSTAEGGVLGIKLVTYVAPGLGPRAGALESEWVYDLGPSLLDLLELGPEAPAEARQRSAVRHPAGAVKLLAPLPRPRSFRDFYAFEQHVATCRRRRGLAMAPEWYQFPVFYFGNAHAVIGPDDPVIRPAYTRELDYELEIGCVIGRPGRDIAPADADRHIAGYLIVNDWSARDVQRAEMQVGLGPAKGKDFATAMGPWLVTPDELADRAVPGPSGTRYDLAMMARVNGREYSRGNWREIHYTFQEMIARASQGVTLYPGEVIGSGTVGTGCLLETGLPWLEPGDVVELEVERLGVLRNTVAAPPPAGG